MPNDVANAKIIALSVDQYDALMVKIDELILDVENLTEKVDNLNLSNNDGFGDDNF